MKAIETQNSINDSGGFKVSGLRWWIISLIFIATLINYIDRVTISVLGPTISKDLGLTNTEFGAITTWFLLAYTFSQAISGKVYDRVGIKKGFSLSIIIWSVAATAHAFARSLGSFSAFRFLLGLGEAGHFPGTAKTVAEWFPQRQRALAMGIFNSGASIGSIIAIPIIVRLTEYFGHWQPTFILTGLLGFGWLVLWWFLYDARDKHRWLTDKERRLIESDDTAKNSDESHIADENATAETVVVHGEITPTWLSLLTYPQTWAIVLARFFVDPVWWLFITWLPKYLADARGFDLKQIGLFAWLPFVAAAAGSLFGGWFAGFLISRGWSVNWARKAIIIASALLMPAGIVAAYAETAGVALAAISVVLFGFQVWINNVQTLPSDFFPKTAIGSVAGLGGMGAGIGSMILIFTTGWVVDNFSYTPILVAAGLLAPIGTIVLLALAGTIQKISVVKTN